MLPEPASAVADFGRDILRRQYPQQDMLLTARLLDFDDLSAEEADFPSKIREEQRRRYADGFIDGRETAVSIVTWRPATRRS